MPHLKLEARCASTKNSSAITLSVGTQPHPLPTRAGCKISRHGFRSATPPTNLRIASIQMTRSIMPTPARSLFAKNTFDISRAQSSLTAPPVPISCASAITSSDRRVAERPLPLRRVGRCGVESANSIPEAAGVRLAFHARWRFSSLTVRFGEFLAAHAASCYVCCALRPAIAGTRTLVC